MRGLTHFAHQGMEDATLVNGASKEEVLMIWAVTPDMFVGRGTTCTATITGSIDATTSTVFKMYFGRTYQSAGDVPSGTLAATWAAITSGGDVNASATLTKPTASPTYMKLSIRSSGGGTTRTLGVTIS